MIEGQPKQPVVGGGISSGLLRDVLANKEAAAEATIMAREITAKTFAEHPLPSERHQNVRICRAGEENA